MQGPVGLGSFLLLQLEQDETARPNGTSPTPKFLNFQLQLFQSIVGTFCHNISSGIFETFNKMYGLTRWRDSISKHLHLEAFALDTTASI